MAFANQVLQWPEHLRAPEIQWRSRIVGFGFEPVDQLQFSPYATYIHSQEQQNALLAMLETIGWLMPVAVNLTTGNCIDGQARIIVSERGNQVDVPVIYVRIKEAEEKAVCLYLNALAKMAHFDKKKNSAYPISKTDEMIEEVSKSRFSQLRDLFKRMVRLDVIPAKGTRLRTDTENRYAPAEQQHWLKVQCARGELECWKLGEARVIGTHEECAQILENWELKTGEVAEQLLGKQQERPAA